MRWPARCGWSAPSGVSPTVAAVLARRGLGDPEEAQRFLDAEDRHDPLSLPGLSEACGADPGPPGARVAHRRARGLRRGRRVLHDHPAGCAAGAGRKPDLGDPQPLRRRLRPVGSHGGAPGRLRGRPADHRGLRNHRGGRGGRRARGRPRRGGHRPPPPRRPATRLHRRASRPRRIRVPRAVRCRGGPEALRGPQVGGRAGIPRRLRRTSTWPRSPPCATWCRSAARTAASSGRAWPSSPGPAGPACVRSWRWRRWTPETCPSTRSDSGWARGSTPPGACSGRTPHSSCMLTEDEGRAAEVARELDLLNLDRREAETRILFAAEGACAPQAHNAAIVVAGEGWHPGVVGIVASRLVERWRRPCVVISMEDGSGRGSGRSISAYDLHAGLDACATHLTRFGGHRMAAGVELDADSLDPFRRALAAHAGGELCPEDLIPCDRVDAVVAGGALGLELAEELERLRPFGSGNPQPNLLVPGARLEGVSGMGEERQHARFNLVTAGGSRSRGVAFGSPPASLAVAATEPHDLVVRLERNRWNGVVEPRLVMRALCTSRPGRLRALGEEEAFWTRLERLMDGVEPPDAPPVIDAVDRRGCGFAGVVGELITSGERVLVGVADVPRRRELAGGAGGRSRSGRPGRGGLGLPGRAARAGGGIRSPGGAGPAPRRDGRSAPGLRAHRPPGLGRRRGGVRPGGLAGGAGAAPRAHGVLPGSPGARSGGHAGGARGSAPGRGPLSAQRRRTAPACCGCSTSWSSWSSHSTRRPAWCSTPRGWILSSRQSSARRASAWPRSRGLSAARRRWRRRSPWPSLPERDSADGVNRPIRL